MFSYLSPEHNLNGYTVVLPSLGVGNVAQLVIDVLVSTLKMEKLAIVWHPAIVPIIGPNAFDSNSDESSSTTACELFVCRSTKLAALQLRAPIVPAQIGEFFTRMMADFAAQHIERLLVLTSSYAYEQHRIDPSSVAFLANATYERSYKSLVEELGWSHFQGETIYGGGFATRVLDVANEHSIPGVVLFQYVSEGDNSTDALEMCHRLNGFLRDVLPKNENGHIRLVSPVSWNLLFGNSAPELLY